MEQSSNTEQGREKKEIWTLLPPGLILGTYLGTRLIPVNQL